MALTLSLNVQSYGARGNGVTDDTVAIQAAIQAAAAGGGIVFFPAGTYLCNIATSAAGLTWALSVCADNVTLMGVPGASILTTTTPNTSTLHITGMGKPAGVGAWHDHWLARLPALPIAPAAAGSMSITLTTPADAAAFAANDLVYLRTGQTIDGFDAQPDAEYGEVASINLTTGVLGLRSPLAKSYAQEYYVSGTSGRTSTAVTANAAPFGVVNATSRTLRNIAVLGLSFRSTAGVATIIGGQVVGWTVEECRSDSDGAGFLAFGLFRFGAIRNNRTHVRGVGTAAYAFPVDSGVSDALIEGNVSTAERVAFQHIHEGAARIRVVNNSYLNGSSAGDEPALSIRGRAYGITIESNTFSGSGASGVAFIDRFCDGGGVVRGNTFRSTSTDTAIISEATGWVIADNDVGDLVVKEFAPFLSGVIGPRPTVVLSTWVADDHLTQTLGMVPRNVAVLSVRVQVTEAFNSSGTDSLTVGHDANPSAYAASVDVSSTGIKTITLGSEAGLVSTARTAKAYYTAGGSAATTGKALVALEYVPVGYPID